MRRGTMCIKFQGKVSLKALKLFEKTDVFIVVTVEEGTLAEVNNRLVDPEMST